MMFVRYMSPLSGLTRDAEDSRGWHARSLGRRYWAALTGARPRPPGPATLVARHRHGVRPAATHASDQRDAALGQRDAVPAQRTKPGG
jgi:hypothetical protein